MSGKTQSPVTELRVGPISLPWDSLGLHPQAPTTMQSWQDVKVESWGGNVKEGIASSQLRFQENVSS